MKRPSCHSPPRPRPRTLSRYWRQADDGRPARTWARQEQWALVLQARNIVYVRVRSGKHSLFYVPPLLEGPARAELRGYSSENQYKTAPAPPVVHHSGGGAVFFLLLLLLWHGLRAGWWPRIANFFGPVDAWNSLVDMGAADVVRMKAHHEWYRAVTALTLHADSAHILSNVVFGSIFCVLLCRAMGLGVGLLLTVGGGALGNICNALVRQGGHMSLGFSTAVFAAVGAMSGSIAVRQGRRRGNALIPLAAGAAILAMLGAEGERTDYAAHVWGLVCGMLLGMPAQWLTEGRKTPVWGQWLAVGLTFIMLAGGWRLAGLL